MKNVMKKAHEITKNIIRKGDSYRETFRLALIFVHSQLKKGVNNMIDKVMNAARRALEGYKYDSKKIVTSDWSKGEYNRTYLKLSYYTSKGKYKVETMGYFDNNTQEYIYKRDDIDLNRYL